MKKIIAAFLILIWLPATTYVGYRLAEESFGWIDKPYFGLTPPKSADSGQKAFDLKAIQEKLPKSAAEAAAMIKTLPPATVDCLKKAVSPETYAAVTSGKSYDLPPDQMLKAMSCLR
jgi:hypothetical protein